jgi:hypothetical protein
MWFNHGGGIMLNKKILSILIISLLIAALAGCGGGGAGGVTGTGGSGGSGGTGGTVTGTMSWAAPATHTDGSPITDLAGYRIYYGTTSGNYSGSIDVVGKDSTSMPVSTLASAVPASGTYFISVTAYDAYGIESDYSNEVSVTL